MAPAEIPDSDEEEELEFAPSPRPAGIDAGDDEEPSPENPGHKSNTTRSGSTDPAFFQSVYDEQVQAARQKSRGAAKAHHQDSHMQGEEEGNDPYDIPSSEDEVAGSFQYKRRHEKEGSTKRKVKTKGERAAPRSSPREAQEEAHQNEQPKRKKRKTTKTLPVPLDHVDEVSLVAIPTPDNDGEAGKVPDASSMPPPPTLPIHELPSTLDPLQAVDSTTTHQHDFADTSGWIPSQDQGPSGPGRDGPLIRSSGSATNINTQRSQPPPFYHDASRAATQENVRSGPGDAVWIGSSPDMLTESATPRRPSRARNPPETVGAPLEEHEQPDELNTDVVDAPDVVSAGYTSNEEPAAVEEPVTGKRKKKQRGRPRKNTPAPAAVPNPPESPKTGDTKVETSIDGGPAKKQKQKKRGRPKKETVKSESKGVPELDTHNGEQAEKLEVKDPVKDTLKSEQTDVSKREQGDAESGTKISEDRDEPRTDIPLPDTPKDLSKSVADNKGASAAKIAVPSSTPGSKPLYRVGLSKRSRIAPLLKIVRKD